MIRSPSAVMIAVCPSFTLILFLIPLGITMEKRLPILISSAISEFIRRRTGSSAIKIPWLTATPPPRRIDPDLNVKRNQPYGTKGERASCYVDLSLDYRCWFRRYKTRRNLVFPGSGCGGNLPEELVTFSSACGCRDLLVVEVQVACGPLHLKVERCG